MYITLSLIKNMISGKNNTVRKNDRNNIIRDAGESFEF